MTSLSDSMSLQLKQATLGTFLLPTHSLASLSQIATLAISPPATHNWSTMQLI